jgi:hypothetical protein
VLTEAMVISIARRSLFSVMIPGDTVQMEYGSAWKWGNRQRQLNWHELEQTDCFNIVDAISLQECVRDRCAGQFGLQICLILSIERTLCAVELQTPYAMLARVPGAALADWAVPESWWPFSVAQICCPEFPGSSTWPCDAL